MNLDLNKLAEEIIESNQYMTIGSSDKDNNSWVSPVVYAYDNKFNFYFVTIPSSRHGANFKNNNKISVAIFDSRQLLGEGVGLQAEAIVKELAIEELPEAAFIYFKRKYPFGKTKNTFNVALKKLLDGKVYHFYKAVLIKTWLNNPNSNIDERVEVILNKKI
jgi:uncharacterized protein YhbP (UPF0306 family)